MLQTSTIKFLKDLKKNNNKLWFDKNRKVYEAAKADFINFIQAVIDQHGKKDTSIKSAANSTYKKLAVQCSADTFVVAESFVLRMKICGKNRQHLVAANR